MPAGIQHVRAPGPEGPRSREDEQLILKAGSAASTGYQELLDAARQQLAPGDLPRAVRSFNVVFDVKQRGGRLDELMAALRPAPELRWRITGPTKNDVVMLRIDAETRDQAAERAATALERADTDWRDLRRLGSTRSSSLISPTRAGGPLGTSPGICANVAFVLIPSERHPDARSALQAAIDHNATIRAAVAFVTRSGVAVLSAILAEHEDVAIEITARAADVTEPEALVALRDEIGADVSVVIGRHARAFHPKLWLVERADTFTVISGSGNLTEGGLVTNDEQFEVIEYRPDDPAVAAQLERIEALTRHAQPLDAIENAAIWQEWLSVRKQQARWRREVARIESKLNERDPIPDRAGDKQRLIDDLQAIYDDTVAADLPRADGEQYYPTRLLVAINGARAGERDPVKVVSDTIRRHTEGLDILLDAGRVDLTLEWLVLDETKPYHDLFGARSIELARSRIEEFRRAGHAIPERTGSSASTGSIAEVMDTDGVRRYLAGLLEAQPDGYALPVLHNAHATLLRVELNHAVVRRDSGEPARIPVRLVRLRLGEMARGRRFLVSELRDRTSDRFSSALGPLLAAFPGIEFDSEDKRLRYREPER